MIGLVHIGSPASSSQRLDGSREALKQSQRNAKAPRPMQPIGIELLPKFNGVPQLSPLLYTYLIPKQNSSIPCQTSSCTNQSIAKMYESAFNIPIPSSPTSPVKRHRCALLPKLPVLARRHRHYACCHHSLCART